MTVARIDLQADDERLQVHEASVRVMEQEATIRGDIRRTANGPVIDAQIDSPGLVLEALLPSQKPAATPAPAAEALHVQASGLWPLPLTGRLGLRAGFLELQGKRLDSVDASLVLEPERLSFTTKQSPVCGIAFPLSVEITPHGTAASVELSAKGEQIEATARCLSDERLLLTGSFDLHAKLRSQGSVGEFRRNLEGSVEFSAWRGEIRRFALLANILALKDVFNLFGKNGPRLDGTGFPYREIEARGSIVGGKLTLDPAMLDSSAAGLIAQGTIDLVDYDSRLTVLVAPFSFLDRLVRRVPVIGYVLGGVLTSLPVGVSGDIRNPVVLPLGPKAVGGEILGVAERLLSVPVRLLDTLKSEVP